MNRLAAIASLVLALASTGCMYVKDRVLDLSDVVDVKYGYGVGLGAKLEATEYTGYGVGYGVTPTVREWFGRRSLVANDQEFLYYFVGGQDGLERDWGEPGPTAKDFFGVLAPINLSALVDHEAPPIMQRFRFGGEIVLPGVHYGLYLNAVELGDFFAGLVTVDFARDDGVPITEQYEAGFGE